MVVRRRSVQMVVVRDDREETESNEMQECRMLQELTGSASAEQHESDMAVRTRSTVRAAMRTLVKPMAAAFSRKH